MRMSFRMSYRDLPPHRDVDFIIELHLGTLPISMTTHWKASVEL